MKKLYLVDVSGMIFRAFYAIRPLSNPNGLPVNALYGFMSMTMKLLREIKPDYMAFVFDHGSKTFRSEIDPNYKAHRKEMPEDLVPQIPYFRRLSEALGIACYDRENYEADDIIGTFTKFGRDNGLEVVIVSGDKDFGQLVKPYVSMYDTMKDVRYDEAGVIEKWGVEPRKMIDYLSIVGDSSDNIPGVAGLGPKGAQKLLADYDSLEDIYENIEKITGATRKKLEENRENAFMSKRLVTIVCDMPFDLKVDDLRLKPIDRDVLQGLLDELDFKTFAKTLLGTTAPPPQSEMVEAGAGGGGSISHMLNPSGVEHPTIAGSAGAANTFVRRAPTEMVERMTPTVEVGMNVGVIKEERFDLAQMSKWLKAGEETWALHTERASYLAQPNAKGWTVAEAATGTRELGALMTEKNLRLRGFDLKDFCKLHQVRTPQIDWDQMLAAYVIRAGNIESPQPLFTLYNGEPLAEIPSPAQLLTAHLRLEGHLRKKIATIGAEKVLFDIEQPLVPILLVMETTGILIDKKVLSEQSASLSKDLAILEKEIHELAGGPVNIGSPKQLGVLLFEKLKMPSGRRTKTGFSTDNEVLEKLSKEFPIAGKILQWRELSKLRSTYVDALPQIADPETHRVHTTFSQASTSTGRLSSINPNLQNIPIRTERGNLIRKAFIAEEGYELVSADYSQIELRILAHITSDVNLMRAFETDADIHQATASEVFSVPLADVTPDMRRKAKAVNFGLAYGQGAVGLAETLRIPRGEASEIIARYFARFSGVKTYMTETVEEAKRKGYVETVFGRRRYLDELFSKSPAVRKFGERAAINAPIQGTASDLVKMAMIKVGIPKDARPLLQVHDELVLEVKKGSVKAVEKDVRAKMEGVADLKVQLKVNTGSGLNWDTAHS